MSLKKTCGIIFLKKTRYKKVKKTAKNKGKRG